MDIIQVHYPGTFPGGVKSFVLECDKCGEDIELVKNGIQSGGCCNNPQCPMHKKAISLEFGHAETTRRYNR